MFDHDILAQAIYRSLVKHLESNIQTYASPELDQLHSELMQSLYNPKTVQKIEDTYSLQVQRALTKMVKSYPILRKNWHARKDNIKLQWYDQAIGAKQAGRFSKEQDNYLIHIYINTPHYEQVCVHEIGHVLFDGMEALFEMPNDYLFPRSQRVFMEIQATWFESKYSELYNKNWRWDRPLSNLNKALSVFHLNKKVSSQRSQPSKTSLILLQD